jgi:chromosome segregation ATPase
MRPPEISDEAIIRAGEALQAEGRRITGFALRQRIGGGNPARLLQVWQQHISQSSQQPELPAEIADALVHVTEAAKQQLRDALSALYSRIAADAQQKINAAEQAAKAELDAATAELERIDAERDAAHSEIERLRAELAEAQQQAAALSARLDACVARADAAEARAQQLQRERDEAIELRARAEGALEQFRARASEGSKGV